ncbi:MAG: cob(I)yrinic acid a,c-diamide adenosyltransferase [Candidatus Omnitrophota bacterium]|jgi:cob(I)alamin adenosyltransferase
MSVRSGKGDKGFTDLISKQHVSKDSASIRAIGNLDELNCHIGLIKTKIRRRKEKEILERIQRAIYIIASEIAIGAEEKRKHGPILRQEDADWVKSVVYELEEKVKIKNYFYTPGESELSAIIDIARTVARRAERSVVGLFKKEKFRDENILSYLNCISDILFIMARESAPKKSVKKRKTRKKK